MLRETAGGFCRDLGLGGCCDKSVKSKLTARAQLAMFVHCQPETLFSSESAPCCADARDLFLRPRFTNAICESFSLT
jgi:hypothetical protein